jgi:uncharacterized protein with PIN domain
MASITIRFYEELNDFLPSRRRGMPFSADFPPASTVKAIIENLGVPHTEVDLVLVNGESEGFDRQLSDGDMVSVFPIFESLDIGSISRVRPAPLREPRFLLDVHLGKLAALLRMFGFDALCGGDRGDEELARVSRVEKRIVLTRDRGLLKRRSVTHGYLVRSLAPREQLVEVLKRFDLAPGVRLFTRCMACNEPLRRVEKKDVLSLLPPKVREAYEEFSRCPRCGRVFWRGTHWERMRELAREVLGAPEAAQSGTDFRAVSP